MTKLNLYRRYVLLIYSVIY